MIAIKYSGNSLPKFDIFCGSLQTRIFQWLALGYVGNKKSHINMDPEAIKFFNSILGKSDSVSKLANIPATCLERYIDDIESQFPTLAIDRKKKEANPNAQTSVLYQCIEKALSNYGYDSSRFPSEELMNDLDLAVCPYCNRNFIKLIQVKHSKQGNNIYVKGQLDHFYPRSLFPYLAICKHNLVPCCPSCNGPSGKHYDNTKAKGIVNPYTLSDCCGLKFKMSISGKGFSNLDTCANAISIDTDCSNNPAMANNENLFHLKELYSAHTDYAAEVYFKSILRTPSVYKRFIGKKIINKGLNYNTKDFERILLGTYTNEMDYHKRPLSKFCADIARQNNLIP